jgi:uncharacterized membrane protein
MADSSTNHQAVSRTARVNAVDLLRGIVMVIMLQ